MMYREANVVDTAVHTLGEVAAHLAWPHYQQLLGHFLKAMQRLGESNKVDCFLTAGSDLSVGIGMCVGGA